MFLMKIKGWGGQRRFERFQKKIYGFSKEEHPKELHRNVPSSIPCKAPRIRKSKLPYSAYFEQYMKATI